MDEEELAGFIIHDELAWRIWMNGYEIGLAQGHQDERAGMEDLADLGPCRRGWVDERYFRMKALTAPATLSKISQYCANE